MSIITDFHTHIFSPETMQKRQAYCSDKAFALLYANPSSRIINADDLIKAMDREGINRSVAMGFPWTEEKLRREQNEYLAISAARFPDRLSCFGSVPLTGKSIVKRAAKDLADMNMAGIGEAAFYTGIKETKSSLHLLLEAGEENHLPVCIHVNEPVGHKYQGKYESDFALLYEVIKEHPSAVIILAHWGGGLLFYELMPEVKEAFKNVYYDSAASPYLYNEKIFSNAILLAGAEKILFGTDFPLIPQKRYIEQIESTVREQAHRNAIFSENAKLILGG